eukprot:2148643-Pyramimonas_sp.AAC.1
MHQEGLRRAEGDQRTSARRDGRDSRAQVWIYVGLFPPRETTSSGRQTYDRSTEQILKWTAETM